MRFRREYSEASRAAHVTPRHIEGFEPRRYDARVKYIRMRRADCL